jgi:hypothetical protein
METSTLIFAFAGIFSVTILTALCWFLAQESLLIIPIILIVTVISMIALAKTGGA